MPSSLPFFWGGVRTWRTHTSFITGEGEGGCSVASFLEKYVSLVSLQDDKLVVDEKGGGNPFELFFGGSRVDVTTCKVVKKYSQGLELPLGFRNATTPSTSTLSPKDCASNGLVIVSPCLAPVIKVF